MLPRSVGTCLRTSSARCRTELPALSSGHKEGIYTERSIASPAPHVDPGSEPSGGWIRQVFWVGGFAWYFFTVRFGCSVCCVVVLLQMCSDSSYFELAVEVFALRCTPGVELFPTCSGVRCLVDAGPGVFAGVEFITSIASGSAWSLEGSCLGGPLWRSISFVTFIYFYG